jgi:hypothetical protein
MSAAQPATALRTIQNHVRPTTAIKAIGVIRDGHQRERRRGQHERRPIVRATSQHWCEFGTSTIRKGCRGLSLVPVTTPTTTTGQRRTFISDAYLGYGSPVGDSTGSTRTDANPQGVAGALVGLQHISPGSTNAAALPETPGGSSGERAYHAAIEYYRIQRRYDFAVSSVYASCTIGCVYCICRPFW